MRWRALATTSVGCAAGTGTAPPAPPCTAASITFARSASASNSTSRSTSCMAGGSFRRKASTVSVYSVVTTWSSSSSPLFSTPARMDSRHVTNAWREVGWGPPASSAPRDRVEGTSSAEEGGTSGSQRASGAAPSLFGERDRRRPGRLPAPTSSSRSRFCATTSRTTWARSRSRPPVSPAYASSSCSWCRTSRITSSSTPAARSPSRGSRPSAFALALALALAAGAAAPPGPGPAGRAGGGRPRAPGPPGPLALAAEPPGSGRPRALAIGTTFWGRGAGGEAVRGGGRSTPAAQHQQALELARAPCCRTCIEPFTAQHVVENSGSISSPAK